MEPAYYVGIDLHKRNLFLSVRDSEGEIVYSRRINCQAEARIVGHFKGLLRDGLW